MKKALVIGATGLVGTELVRQLLDTTEVENMVTLGRRKTDFKHDKLSQVEIDFENLEASAEHFQGDALFCCLGTTQAKAGGKKGLYKVDFTYVNAATKLAAQNGVTGLYLISSVGADSGSSTSFYLKTKGEVEEAVQEMGFQRLHIFRPSLLLGDRDEFRPAEWLGSFILRPLAPLLGKYTPVTAEEVASGMLKAALEAKDGTYFHASDELRRG